MRTICLFGIYDPEYSRNRVLVRGFKDNGWNVVECRVDPKLHNGFSKYLALIRLWLTTKRQMQSDNVRPDIFLVAFPGHTVVWLARFLCPGRKIVFDAFLSRFDSNVNDRKSYGAFSLRGIADWLLDWSSCAMSDVVLLDTAQHISYFSKTFGVSVKKMICVPVGADTENFYPREQGPHGESFVVHFHGMFIPLQGLRFIIEAANLLKDYKDIVFEIVGSGQQYREISDIVENWRMSNVLLTGVQPLSMLPEYVKRADICLGVFGDTEKAARVIPNKVYECMAMKKAVITSDTPAIREFFTNEKDVLLCKQADGKSLAEAIIRLKNDPHLTARLAEASFDFFDKNMRPKTIVANLISFLNI